MLQKFWNLGINEMPHNVLSNIKLRKMGHKEMRNKNEIKGDSYIRNNGFFYHECIPPVHRCDDEPSSYPAL